MYQALYRKYRPKTLEDVCGQDIIVRIIKNSIKKHQINHAYLFAGPRGTGKTSIAKIFARIVNCKNPKDCTPCGNCPSCIETNNNDIIEIDAASNNGVDEIRELRSKVNLVPAYGKYKVYIIDEVHMLTVGAFNALLKTLEEPPEHIIFVLATTDPQKIPETILSRCQRFDFKKISAEAIVDNLKKIAKTENIKIEDQALTEIARLSDGGMRDSVGMLDQARAYTNEKITAEDIHNINGTLTEIDLNELLESIIANNLEKILKNTDKFNNQGKNFNKLIEEFINHLRNILLYKKVPQYFKENNENVENYEEISKKIDDRKIFHYIEILNKYSNEMKYTNNTKLMFELAFIEMISENSTPVIDKNTKEVKKSEQNIVSKETEPNKIPEKSEKEEKEPKEEIKSQKNPKIEEFLNYMKKIRIDNTLAKFNKKRMIEIKTNLEEKLNELLLNPEYSHEASILLDGILKAASEENIMYVYKTPRIAHSFNENIINLESAIEKVQKKHYNLIAIDEEEWEVIKDQFNNKKRPFVYQKEEFNLEEVFKEEPDDITSMFEDIIEYN